MGKNKDTMKRVLKFISPYKGKIILMLLMALPALHLKSPCAYTHLESAF